MSTHVAAPSHRPVQAPVRLRTPGPRPATQLAAAPAAVVQRGWPSRFLAWMQARPLLRGLPVVLLLVAANYALDDVTDAQLSVSVFYLVPVCLATWVMGLRGGVALAVVCALGSFIIGKRHAAYSHDVYRYWDLAVHFGFYSVVCVILAELRASYRRIADLARRDSLTGLANHRRFHELAEHELHRARRSGRALTLAHIDVDDFKLLNDSRGHAEGDRLLVRVAECLATLRATDVAARLGGDEFVVLMPETGADAARLVVDRLAAELAHHARVEGWPNTFSVGVVTFHAVPDTVRDMVLAADEVMYRVKHGTKNAVSYVDIGAVLH